MRTLAARKLVDLKSAGIRGVIVDWSVDVDGVLAVLTATRMPRYRIAGSRSFQRYSTSTNVFTAHLIRPGIATTVKLPPTRENFALLRRLGADHLLLTSGARRKGEEPNGAIYDLRGTPRRRLNLGAGVQHLLVTPDGRLWVAYIDEASSNPLSHGGGLVQLDFRGRKTFALHPKKHPACIDCYAMTMAVDGTIHALFYPDFPLVQISAAGRLRVLPVALPQGAGTLAVSDSLAITDGGYTAPDRLFATSLTTGRRTRVAIVTERGRPIKANQRFTAAGVLYLLEGSTIFAVDVPAGGKTTTRSRRA